MSHPYMKLDAPEDSPRPTHQKILEEEQAMAKHAIDELLEQNWFVAYPLDSDGNKVFKEQLSILMFVQVCRIID